MAINPSPPPSEQSNPYLPPGPEPLIFEDFETINTSTTRVGVGDKQMAWCSGFFPIGPRQLRTMYGIGASIFTSAGPEIVFYGFANIGALPVCIIFLFDGSIWQAATTTGAITQIAPPNAIVNPSVTTTGMSQWGSQYVLIVNKQANGYFVWDGTVLYQAGSLAPVVTITNVGSGFTSVPTVAISGGSGTGATFVAELAAQVGLGGIGSVNISDGGAYSPGAPSYPPAIPPTVVVSGGGGSGANLQANMVFNSGTGAWFVGSVTVVAPGSGFISAPSISFVGGDGLIRAASGTANITSSTTLKDILITNPGNGYKAGETPTLTISGGGGSSATATVTLMPFGISGTGVETYSQRVWIINGSLLQFSAPSNVSDFATSDGGGSTTSNDPFLRVGYTRLIQTNGFLYLIGDSSISYISGVQTSGSPPTTTYTLQNADPEVGTPYPMTADVFGRNIVFANSFGVHVNYGAAVTKVSEPLDGVFNTVPNFNGVQLSAAKAVVFGKKIWVLLVPIIDPVTGLLSNELICWDGQKKWFSTKQDVALTFVNFQEINSVLTAWGTDGGEIFPLFQNPTIGFTKTVQSKLWTKPGGYQFIKAPARFWGLAQYYGTRSQGVALTIDTEYSAQPYTLTPPGLTAIWYNSSGVAATWTNSTPVVATWALQTTGIRVFDPQAIGQQGVTSGMTLSTQADDMAFISTMIEAAVVTYRG